MTVALHGHGRRACGSVTTACEFKAAAAVKLGGGAAEAHVHLHECQYRKADGTLFLCLHCKEPAEVPDGKLRFFRQWPGGVGRWLVCINCQSEGSSEQVVFADSGTAVQMDGAGSAASC